MTSITICICECKYFVNLIFKFSWQASEFLRILNVVFGEMTGNDILIDHGLQTRKYFDTHNFLNCIKHEMKYNFLFMEYVNITEIINNIRKIQTKRGKQKILENMDEIYKIKKKNIQLRDPNHRCHH